MWSLPQYFRNSSSVVFPLAAVLQKLLRHGSVPQDAIPQEWTATAWATHRAHLLTDNLLLCWLSTGYSFLQGTSTSSSCSLDIWSDMAHHRLQADSLLHHGPLHGLQGNFCSYALSTSSLSFCHLGGSRDVSLTFSHSPSCCRFYAFLNMLSQRHNQ